MAMSRWMWPSPMGLESHRIRRRLPRGGRGGVLRSAMGGTVCVCTGRSSTKSRMSRLTLAASRPGRPCPPPANVTSRAPGTASAKRRPWEYGTTGSWLPWRIKVGTAIRGSRSHTLSLPICWSASM